MDIENLKRSLLATECELRGLQVLHAFRLARRAVKFNPDWPSQPRVPAGNAEGGQWTDGGASAPNRTPSRGSERSGRTVADVSRHEAEWRTVARRTLPQGGEGLLSQSRGGSTVYSETGAPGTAESRILVQTPGGSRIAVLKRGEAQQTVDADGDILSQSASARESFGSASVQPAFSPGYEKLKDKLKKSGRYGKAAAALLELFDWYNSAPADKPRKLAVLRTDVVERALGGGPERYISEVRQVDEDEAAEFCPRLPEVQAKTTSLYNQMRPLYRSATDLGTAVHSAMREYVRAQSNPSFKAEESYTVDGQSKYGARGSVRVDVMEQRDDGTVCVYDLKTGDSRMSPSRFRQIANNVDKAFPGPWPLLVIEVRP